MENKKIAEIRVRGLIKIDKNVEDTFRKLKLFRKNCCVIIDNRKSYEGMLRKIKDYSTWGEIDEETFKLLLMKRGKLPGNKPLNEEYLKEKSKLDADNFVKEFFGAKKHFDDVPGLKRFFRLGMPSKGFGRKGIKVQFSLGGALGYRKNMINDLIKRMI